MSVPLEGSAALSMGPFTPYDLQDEIAEAAQLVRYHTMVPFPRLAVTYQIAVHCDAAQLPGAYVECGVWKGGAAGTMAIANLRHGAVRRDFHLFDSFSDICEPDERFDGQRAVAEARQWGQVTGPLTGRLQSMTGFYSTMGGPGSVAEVEDLFFGKIVYPPANVHIHRGWFQDTIPRAEVGPIALLRVDCDYYAATMFCLSSLYDKVVRGGFVVFDDYGCYEGCRRAVDEFLASNGITAFLHHVDAEGRYLVKA